MATRATAETLLIQRLGALLTAAGLDGVTVDGTNANLNDPIGWAIRQLGGTVTAPALVTDADCATVGSDDFDQWLDLAELRTLENALGNLDMVDIKVGPREEKLDQLGKRLEALITRKYKLLADRYSYGLGPLTPGVIALGFQQTNDEDDL